MICETISRCSGVLRASRWQASGKREPSKSITKAKAKAATSVPTTAMSGKGGHSDPEHGERRGNQYVDA